jgi:hypothetical protein
MVKSPLDSRYTFEAEGTMKILGGEILHFVCIRSFRAPEMQGDMLAFEKNRKTDA